MGPKAALTLPALPLHTTVLLLLYQCRRETEECSGSQNSSQHPVVAEPIILLHSTIVYQQTCLTCYSNKSTGETSTLIMIIPIKRYSSSPNRKHIFLPLICFGFWRYHPFQCLPFVKYNGPRWHLACGANSDQKNKCPFSEIMIWCSK